MEVGGKHGRQVASKQGDVLELCSNVSVGSLKESCPAFAVCYLCSTWNKAAHHLSQLNLIEIYLC